MQTATTPGAKSRYFENDVQATAYKEPAEGVRFHKAVYFTMAV
jgi:hypothetical protein